MFFLLVFFSLLVTVAVLKKTRVALNDFDPPALE